MNSYVRAFGKKMAPINPTMIVAIAPNGPNIKHRATTIAAPINIFETVFMIRHHATPTHRVGANRGECV